MLLAAMLCFSGTLTSLAQGDTWVQKSDLGYNAANAPEPTTRSGAVGFSIGSKGYIGTGDNTKDFWEYDPLSNSWTQKADFGGTARSGAVGFSIGNKGYIGTGIDGSSYRKDFWEYDPATNTWTQKADFGGTERFEAVGFSIGSKGYLGTGFIRGDTRNPGNYVQDFWEYDPTTNSWTQKADFGGGRRTGAVGFSIGNKGYIGTGFYYNGNYDEYFNDFWEYDPDLNTWTKKKYVGGFAIYERSDAVGFTIGGKGYISTGYLYDYSSATYFKDVWEYNPTNNIWTRKADFGGTARKGAVGFSIGSKGYIGMGIVSTNESDFWEYDPAENFWTKKGVLRAFERAGAVGFSIGNKGYIGTGTYGSLFYYKDFWEYDPATNTWTQKADFGGTARSGAVGFSIGNKGYLGTGFKGGNIYDSYNYAQDFWEYDPTLNTWTQKADFGGARSNAVGFSIGNKGYLGTGFIGGNTMNPYNYAGDFWEYDPTSDKWIMKAFFGGDRRSKAVGFSIGNKGYLGTGYSYYDDGTIQQEMLYDDFWEYDPAKNTWTVKKSLGDWYGERSDAVGFSIGNKGYIGTGDLWTISDFWEYDPPSNTWRKKADFGGGVRSQAVGFSIGTKGYIGTGYYNGYSRKDFWEYTPDTTCTPPFNLQVTNITDTAARLTWALPVVPVSGFQVQYGAAGGSTAVKKRVQGTKSQLVITGLQPNTKYLWKIRSICATDTSVWVSGPKFTTTASALISSTATALNGNNSTGAAGMLVMPNPNKGSFSVQLHLPATAATTILSLFNNLGEKIWQQHAGRLSGSVNRNIALDNTLPSGVYVLLVQHGETRMMQKVVVVK